VSKMKKRPALPHQVQKYDPKIHIPLLLEMFSKGDSLTAYLVAADIVESTFYEWTNTYPAFDEAYDKANNSARAWWENYGKNGATQPNFNFAYFNSVMINRFGQTPHRKLKIKNIANVDTHADRFNVVMQEVANGALTGHELKQLSDSLVCGVKIAEVTSMANDIKDLQQRLANADNQQINADDSEDNA